MCAFHELQDALDGGHERGVDVELAARLARNPGVSVGVQEDFGLGEAVGGVWSEEEVGGRATAWYGREMA